jgi:hypothetical protein
MPGNADPIFSRVGSVSTNNGTGMGTVLTAAAADYTGAGADNILVWTADPTNGGFIQRLRLKALGTNVQSVLRVFINNGSANTTASNNSFYGELTLLGTSGSSSAATIDLDYPMNFALDPGFRIYVGLGTAVASGWKVTPIAGKY